MANAWIIHLKKYRAAHPGTNLKQTMKQAKKTYKKGGRVVTGRTVISGGRLKTGGRVRRKKKKKKGGDVEGLHNFNYGLMASGGASLAIPVVGDIAGGAMIASGALSEGITSLGEAFDWW